MALGTAHVGWHVSAEAHFFMIALGSGQLLLVAVNYYKDYSKKNMESRRVGRWGVLEGSNLSVSRTTFVVYL